MPKTIVVIGGALGGPVAAARARSFDEHARIVLLEKADHVSWVQADLRYHLEGKVQRLQDLDQERSAFFDRRHRIEVRTGAEAVGLDIDARRVLVKTSAGTERLPFDAVIFSGGAANAWPNVDGLRERAPGLVGFRNWDDLMGIRACLEAGARRAVVLGCGHNGLDAAEGLLAAGLEVDVVDRAGRILPSLSLTAARAAARLLTSRGIRLRLGEGVTGVELLSGNRRALTLSSGARLEADVVVVCTGMKPRTRLLGEAGASLNPDGSVRVDPHMATTLPRVFACGTAVCLPHAVSRAPVWNPNAAISTRTAQIAGRSAALVSEDRALESLSPVAGTEVMEIGPLTFGRTGLSDAEARSAFGGERVQVVTVHSWSSEAWLGSASEERNITIRLVVETEQDRVVGGEVWGTFGVPRRVDMLAAAVLEGWSPSRLAYFDVAYSPSIGPALDPINAAGSLAEQTLADEAWPLDAEALALRLARGEPMTLLDVGKGGSGDERLWPEGTQHIGLEDLRDRADSLPKDRPVVLLSHTGRRGQLASRILKQRGFQEVWHLDGGALSWRLIVEE
jgi:NADPH-dependent 2,4-dienoyl-CoA reductase/sulfur reductase-like enzyme/rhodanese-related sulfurtransferase